jgi:pimeloyl-ACP methyl ester carboxylesterase
MSASSRVPHHAAVRPGSATGNERRKPRRIGKHDPFVPVSNAEGLKRGLPRSKLNVLECGHFAWEDGAAEYGQLARDWIRGGYARV